MTFESESTPPPPVDNAPKPLTRSQRITVWAGIWGSAIGTSAWLIVMAAMATDLAILGFTLAVVVVLAILFGRLSLKHPTQRFPLLAGMIILTTAHCLAMYWWRFDKWRSSSAISPEALVREKEMVTITIVAMISIVFLQFLLFYWLQRHSQKNRMKAMQKREGKAKNS